MIKFFNTMTGKVEPFRPLRPDEVKLYTCGPTVYEYAHIGNFRAYMFEDLLKRFLQFMGFKVTHVMNITDVDDKTIRDARQAGKTLSEYTETYIRAFFEDIDTLRIQRADRYPKATEHVPEMVEMIRGLMEKGYAYEKDGSVYFNIAKFLDYGRLSKIDLKELRYGVRVDSDEYEKESLQDFALWKAKKGGEPFWDTEIGPGRPGWHIECSVMSSKYLGDSFDIHCGGVDNIFPHHENEIAQSEAYFGKKFVKYWIHCHHLIVDGEKMSKSKGNQYTLRDLIEKGADPMAIRLLLLSTHYRKMLNFSFDALSQSQASLQRIRDFLSTLKSHPFKPGENSEVSSLIDDATEKFKAGLSDDLNISVSMTALFELVKKSNILISKDRLFDEDSRKLVDLLRSLDRVLAVLPEDTDQSLPAAILSKIQEREKARLEKNYALADKLRKELSEAGIELEDTKVGARWKIRKD